MDTTTVVQRKKLGRPPKAVAMLKATQDSANALMQCKAELGEEAALVAISPIPDEQGGGTPGGVIDTSGECRRSSRKKIIKFDVRDLLNKHRKPHKIQIEARIDSNSPSVASNLTTAASKDAVNNSTSKEKCFIEKTSIIQRSMSFDHPQHDATQVPIPLKTEIFKPNQASSLIVAQMESISSTPTQIKKTKSIIETARKSNSATKAENVVPRRRGRPPKNRSLIEKSIADEADNESSKIFCNTVDQSKDSKVCPSTTYIKIVSMSTQDQSQRNCINEESRRDFKSNLSEQNVAEIKISQGTLVKDTNFESAETLTKSFQSQFENTLRRIQMPESDFLSKSKAISEIEKPTFYECQKSNEVNIESNLPKHFKAISDNDSEIKYENVSTKEMESIVLFSSKGVSIDDENIKQEMFEEKAIHVIANKHESDNALKLDEISDEKTNPMSHITLPIKKQLSKLQEVQAELIANESNKEIEMIIGAENENIPISRDAAMECEIISKTSTPTPQRNERRSGRRLGDGPNKTLEETFAEIAVNSSKVILDTTAQEESLIPTTETEDLLLVLTQAESMEYENSKNVSDVQANSLEPSSSRSMSPKEQTTDKEVLPIKRRGRKPKPKVVVEKQLEKNDTFETVNFLLDKPKEEFPDVIASKPKEAEIVAKKSLDTSKATSTFNSSHTVESNDAASLEPPFTTCEVRTTSAERKHKEYKTKKIEYDDEVSPSKKSTSHQKSSISPLKSDTNSSKHMSFSTEKMKQHRGIDSEDTARVDKKSADSTQKQKVRFSAEAMTRILPISDTNKTVTDKASSTIKHQSPPEKSKKLEDVSQATAHKIIDDKNMQLSSSNQMSEDEIASKSSPSASEERSALDNLRKSNSLSPEKIPLQNEQIPAFSIKEKLMADQVIKVSLETKEQFENEIAKKSFLVSKERSATDSLKKSGLLSPETASDGSTQKAYKSTKDETRKSLSITKEKLNSDGTKKSSSTSKERSATDMHSKKSSSFFKEKLTLEEKLKKMGSIGKEKSLSSDNAKKSSSTSKDKAGGEGISKFEKALYEASINNPAIDKKQHERKKHKSRSHDTSLSTSKSKTISSSVTSVTPSSITKEQSSLKSHSSTKSQYSKSHKRRRKHKELPETPRSKDCSKYQENSGEKIGISSEEKQEQISVNKESKDAKKQAYKERQKKLKEAFDAALQDNSTQKIQLQSEVQSLDDILYKESTKLESHTEIREITLPPTPGEVNVDNDMKEEIINPSTSADQTNQPTELKSVAVVESDPLYDIEKFIEAGVNLLKRDYKLAEDDDGSKAEPVDNAQEPSVQQSPNTVGEIKHTTDPQSEENAVILHDTIVENLDLKSELPNPQDFYETPVDTPASTPAASTPSSSPTPADNSVDTYYYSEGVRRSHRLKKITNTPKALVGRGLVRDRDRERLALRDDVETKSYYSIEDHLMDLAEVEAKNAKFLKEMEERLSNFEVIKENEYHCERVVSREARKMVCDCFLTPEEAERGELGCGEDCLNRLLMIECSVNCKVGERCTNRRFQKFLCAPCRVFRTEKKGFGIMADVEIHPGEFIMEYVGEVLDSEEFEDRRVAYSKDKNRHYYFMALRSDAIIDATIKGNVSRFINHSCDPNAETQKWTVNGELRIGFFSRKAIMPGEEITFDYQYQRYGREAQRCYCESSNCRGWIGEEPASDEGEQVDDEEDDDEDDDEYEDEDESDVVSMVKGLMSVEDGEDDDGKDEMMSEETRRTIQDAAVKAQLRKNQTLENVGENEMEEPSLDGETDESKQKFMAYLSKISAKIELHKKNVREEKKRKRQQRKQAAIDRRPPTTASARFLEDPDLEDEIDFLSRCGLKNQSDTLRLSRLMVRAKLVTTRLNLLAILRAGELPCRRLFLDYHGLHLLHGWINEDKSTDMTIRLALLETLESLPIPNKTILTESKVYQSIRSWCNDETLPPSVKAEGSSSSPSDDSSKESATGSSSEKQTPRVEAEISTNENESPKTELEKLALKLLSSWDNLPEIFRIPKRERIEQMKEHEREADRQYAATVEADTDDDKTEISTDRYQRDRFERRFGRPQGGRTITVLGSGSGSIAGTSNKRLISSDVLSPEDTKHLSKEQRRELFAAKVARDEAEKREAERRREFETKCSFFGLDPLVTRPEDIPFCVSDTGKWYNERRQIIPTPPAFAHVPTPTKPMSTNPTDYYLPSAATKLPPEWTYAITEQGTIYYYHLKHRVPQWEPPTLEQINMTKWSDGESESEEDEVDDTNELSEERIKEIEAIETQEDLNAFLKKIVQDQRQTRYKRLVDERPISPRREEDRIYNQIEMRKYKENKEKIKKRKEEIRRRRSEAIKNSMLNMCTLGSLDNEPSTSAAISSLLQDNIKSDVEPSDLPDDALPIQDYLLSSDEDNDIDEMKAECNNSPLLDKIVQGDKIVDELDALTTKRQLKRPLPPHRDLSSDLNVSVNMANESLLTSIEKIEHKKRKQEKKEKSKRSKESSDAKYRKLKEKFRCEIAGIIVQHLKPYRKDSCIFGRIKSNEDFNHLAKKLTHFVMIKELKYCESVGQTLVVTESVKNKSREFIRKYMAKYEAGYIKPDNDPEFKDIPYTL